MAPLVVRKEGNVAVLTINRPKVLGSIDPPTIQLFIEMLTKIAHDDDVRCLVLTGTGRGFCAGAQLGGNSSSTKKPSAHATAMSMGESVSDAMLHSYNPLMIKLKTFPKPLLVAVNGVAAGGGVGLALSGDIVLAAKSARFELVFAPKLGLAPDLGSVWFMSRAIGRAKTLAFALTGEKLIAEEAERLGLVWKVVDDGKLQDEAMKIARRIAQGPTLAFLSTRRVVDGASLKSFEEQLDAERKAQRELGDTPDFKQAMRAFVQGKKPLFTGKL